MARTIVLTDRRIAVLAVVAGAIAAYPLTEAIVWLYGLLPIWGVIPDRILVHTLASILALVACTLTLVIDKRL